jgi:uncharacterized membrane protein
MIWLFFILLTSIVAWGSFAKWNILLIATIGILTNVLWAYLATNTKNNDLLIKYAMFWDVGYVLIFALIPALFLGVQTNINFWIGVSFIVLGTFILNQ